MGRLTADFTRLVDAIRNERMERHRFNQATKHETAERKRTVEGMMAGCHAARAEMARRQRRFLHEFTTALEHSVDALRSGLRTDLAGARAMWFGATPAPSPTREHSKRGMKTAGA